MPRRLLPLVLTTAVVAAAAFWVVTRPAPVEETPLSPLAGDAARGRDVFHVSGCASCHAAEGARGEAKLVLSGGRHFASPFGTFVAPNISPDPVQGIGGWSLAQFAHAIQRGIGPGGEHLYPALPYTTYVRMAPQDVADLHAFMQTLPPDATPSQPHEIGFPFNIRRLLGVWQMLFLRDDWVVTGDLTPEEERGRYLVEAMGHCGECHTPRGRLGEMDTARWLAGGPSPAGEGRIPNITPGKLDWSRDEIVTYLTEGTTPDYDSVGGEMSPVVDELAQIPLADVEAIAAYLKRVPPIGD